MILFFSFFFFFFVAFFLFLYSCLLFFAQQRVPPLPLLHRSCSRALRRQRFGISSRPCPFQPRRDILFFFPSGRYATTIRQRFFSSPAKLETAFLFLSHKTRRIPRFAENFLGLRPSPIDILLERSRPLSHIFFKRKNSMSTCPPPHIE